uniref:Uncharacterized protein n=1 Tax=Timema poppense TaxID=170557 RepID=A0A7R9D4X1_TIMPO|nr:unnamed protein product [Timema poppensis]
MVLKMESFSTAYQCVCNCTRASRYVMTAPPIDANIGYVIRQILLKKEQFLDDSRRVLSLQSCGVTGSHQQDGLSEAHHEPGYDIAHNHRLVEVDHLCSEDESAQRVQQHLDSVHFSDEMADAKQVVTNQA